MSDDRQQKLAAARKALIAKKLKGKLNTAVTPALTIQPRPEDAPARASFGQQRLWYLQQLHPDSTAYNMVSAAEVRGMVDVRALEQAVHTIVERHEALRTAFVMQDGEIIQQVTDSPTVTVHEETLDADAVTRRIQQIVAQPFDLTTAPLLRVTLLRPDDAPPVLVFVVHHIVCDEWSLGVLWRELTTTYAAQVNEQAPNLPDLPVQYADVTHWQHEQMQSGAWNDEINYWRNQLSGDLPLLHLPTDHPRPAVQAYNGELLTTTLPDDVSQAVQAISKTARTTPFVTLLAAFQVLLHRYTGQNDILVGTPVANRGAAEVENLIGFFLNTLVMRADFAESQSFNKLLADVRHQSLAALANQNVPFDELVRVLQPPRDASYHPIFQVMFVYQDEETLPQLGGADVHPFQVDAGVSKFDLTLFARLQDGAFNVGVEFNTALFRRSTGQRLLAHYASLLRSIAHSGDTPVSELNLLPDEERRQLLSIGGGEAHPEPDHTLIHDYIARQPDTAAAVMYNGEAMTYGELNARSNQVAHYLLRHGLRVGTPVGICVERSPEMLVGILGILKAGGAYVPIDPAYPQERIRYIIEDAGITTLLMQSALMADFAGQDVAALPLDASAELTQLPACQPDVKITPGSHAYIIYTSGSTGKPKGVRITHYNLVHSTHARFIYYPQHPEAFLLLSSFAFDSSVVGIFWTLCTGGTLYLPPQYAERDVTQLADLISEYDITHLLALPSLYGVLLDYADSAKIDSLNTVMVAGEACPIDLVQRHYTRLPNATLYNEYGPTEGTVWSTAWAIPPDAQKMLIGSAIPTMQTYILDGAQQPVPFGIAGELYIGGKGIAEGYHNRPALTAERFLANPFGDGRLYRTGDLARYLPDGTIEFLGRVDHQVKINGYRIELGEIEEALRRHSAVTEAAVLPMEDTALNSNNAPEDDLTERIAGALASHPGAARLLADIEAMSDDEAAAIVKSMGGEQ